MIELLKNKIIFREHYGKIDLSKSQLGIGFEEVNISRSLNGLIFYIEFEPMTYVSFKIDFNDFVEKAIKLYMEDKETCKT